MSSGERPMGAAKGKQSDIEALCHPPLPPCPGPRCVSFEVASLCEQAHRSAPDVLFGVRRTPPPPVPPPFLCAVFVVAWAAWSALYVSLYMRVPAVTEEEVEEQDLRRKLSTKLAMPANGAFVSDL